MKRASVPGSFRVAWPKTPRSVIITKPSRTRFCFYFVFFLFSWQLVNMRMIMYSRAVGITYITGWIRYPPTLEYRPPYPLGDEDENMLGADGESIYHTINIYILYSMYLQNRSLGCILVLLSFPVIHAYACHTPSPTPPRFHLNPQADSYANDICSNGPHSLKTLRIVYPTDTNCCNVLKPWSATLAYCGGYGRCLERVGVVLDRLVHLEGCRGGDPVSQTKGKKASELPSVLQAVIKSIASWNCYKASKTAWNWDKYGMRGFDSDFCIG